jgi:hypothetical protein
MTRFGRTRRAALAIPATAAGVLLIATLAAPLNASAAVTARRSSIGSAAMGRIVRGARSAMSRRSQAGSGALASHQSIVPCTFNGQADLVPNVTAGENISVVCPSGGFLPNEQVLIGEASPLLLAVDVANAQNEVDGGNIQAFTSDSQGGLTASFILPSPFSAADPAAKCPPTQIQANSGLNNCLLAVTDSNLNVAAVALQYSGQPVPQAAGYWEGASDGGIFSFGEPFYGSVGGMPLTKPVVGMAFDPDTGGYWEVASDGGIFSFNAPFLGSMGGKPLDKPIVGMAFDPNSGGYWEVASDGGIFSFGGAGFFGSEGGQPIDKPIVAMIAEPFTGGYYEVASDGGIFAFNAPFFGSVGGTPLVKPVVGMALDSNTGGYWEVASDGGIFSFNAPFQGSEGGKPLTKPIVGIADDSLTEGYWEVASDGGIFAFNAPFAGSEGGKALAKPIVGIAPALIE